MNTHSPYWTFIWSTRHDREEEARRTEGKRFTAPYRFDRLPKEQN